MSTWTINFRGMLRGALLALMVCLLLGSGAVASVAEHSDKDTAQQDRKALSVSLDGATWTDAITRPLFDPSVRWVPGDVRTAQFFVRNTKPEAGDLSLVLERPTRAALLETTFLTIAARAGSGPWVEVASGGSHELIDSAKVASDAEVPVELRASYDFAAPNTSMVLASDLDLTLTLTQGGVVADANSDTDPRDPDGNPNQPGSPNTPDNHNASNGAGAGVLPDTGSPLRSWVLPLALLLLAAGAVLVARRTELEQDDSP